MNLAKLSANGQIAVQSESVVGIASVQAIYRAQSAFAGAAREMGVTDEEDVQAIVDEVRYGKE